jgi:lipoprotein-releasing system permease protein
VNAPFFIAKRLTESRKKKKNISRPVIAVTVTAMALSMSVMLISINIISGFKNEIKNKIVGFGSHIQILNFDANQSFETIPIDKTKSYAPFIDTMHGIKHIQAFSTKAGILKKGENHQGIICKGVSNDYSWDFFNSNLKEGKLPDFYDTTKSDEILISKYLKNLLEIEIGDFVGAFFVQNPPAIRRFKVVGIYETGLVEEFDKNFIICDIKHIPKLNNWSENLITGWEIEIDNFENLETTTEEIYDMINMDFFENGSMLKVINIKEKYPQIFDWLRLLDTNVIVILALMILVAIINMVAGLLVLILEKTNMIGVMKSFGISNTKIRSVFIYQSGFLIIRGLIIGNIIGLGLCYLQYKFGIIRLDPSTYYIDRVPINFNGFHIILLNAGSIAVTVLAQFIPSAVISKMSPEKTIKFS